MKVYCPYCKKEVEYKIEQRELKEFRGIEVNTFENVAICNECNQDLYVNKIEDENNERIYKIYREKANIIKAEDIVKLREKYDISQRELTAILGFGKMTINRYERGGLPTKSQSDYIKLLIENEDKFIEKVNEAYENNNITEKTYKKIVSDTPQVPATTILVFSTPNFICNGSIYRINNTITDRKLRVNGSSMLISILSPCIIFVTK